MNKYFTPNLVESKNVAENLLNNKEDMGLNDDDKVLEPVNMDEMVNNNNEEILEPLIVDESNFFEKDDEQQKHKIGTQLANEGYNDLHNLSRCLTAHEAIKEHMECMTDWLELERRLQKNQTIDARAQRIKDHETYTTYLGSKIQNELIEMLAGEVRKKLLAKVKKAKYFSVILDCTLDISHKEQMSLVIWCLDESENSTKVKEYWIEFLEVDDTYGLGLFMHLKNALIHLELDIDDIRGQGYDNGSNMKGKHKGLTVKPLSQTRWESHVESVKPIKEQTAQIRDALLDLTNNTEDPKTRSEAESLALYELEKFEFLLGVSENMDIDAAIKLLQGIIIFLEEYRDSGFDKAMVEAKEMASEMGIEAVFREKRVIRRKKQFDESSSTEITLSAEESLRVNYFLFIVDQAHSSIKSRFAQFKKYQEIFGFLFNVERLQRSDDESLLRSCKNFESSLAHNGCSDVNGDDLFSELTFLKCYLPEESKSAIDVLDYLKKIDGCFPNDHVLTKSC
ncbi:uncharacterized protein LOC122036375 [Zingiber officinale]|uniref:uncharacterized protein LOC122036375 n=1 Tax=Zingiber officinale TaxID=94328 RepID=UPI001C4B1AB4|nr:uncharacterized protein LOC122036375 [Zingiber officinale]